MQCDDNILIIDVSNERSSLIRRVEYYCQEKYLAVYLRYQQEPVIYQDVGLNHFEEFKTQPSIGKYYLHYIKQNFKQFKPSTMSEKRKPKGINIAKNAVRWIDWSLDVTKINKDWLVQGEKGGVYLNGKLRMLPDGTVDKFECLGFMVQSVPSDVYKAAEAQEKGSGKKIDGIILGNAKELEWDRDNEGQPGVAAPSGIGDEVKDDLPF